MATTAVCHRRNYQFMIAEPKDDVEGIAAHDLGSYTSCQRCAQIRILNDSSHCRRNSNLKIHCCSLTLIRIPANGLLKVFLSPRKKRHFDHVAVSGLELGPERLPMEFLALVLRRILADAA